MIKITCKEIEGNHNDGYVEFLKKDTGEKCHIHLQMLFPDALIVYPDGRLEMECRPSFSNFFKDGLVTDELVINMTSMFTMVFKLEIGYFEDCVKIKIVPSKNTDDWF